MADTPNRNECSKGYIFDGRILHRDVANYQLIDITDPLLAGLIRNEKARREKLTVSVSCLADGLVALIAFPL